MANEQNKLRCSVVWERTLLEERVFRPGAKVTVGQAARATFTLPASRLGKAETILRANRNGAVLALRPGLMGQVRIHGRMHDVEQLLDDEAGLALRRGDALEYHLSPGDVGVLVFGRVGLQFDFVDTPERPPPSSLGQVLGADRTVGQLFCGGLGVALVLILFSRFFSSPPAEFTVEQLPDRFVSFITDDPNAARALKKELKRRREERARRKKEWVDSKPTKKKPNRTDKATANGAQEDAETRRIRAKVSSKGVVGAIAKARKKKGALADVLEQGGLAVDLNDAVQALDRGARARVISSTGSAGGLMSSLVARRGTLAASGEGTIEAAPRTGRTGRRAARNSRLADRLESKVTLSLSSSEAQVSGGTLSRGQIARVVQSNKGAIRYCYESQLNRYPTLRGKVVVDFIIETDGGVKTVRVPTNTLTHNKAGARVASCLIRFIRRWRFPKPQGGKVRVIYPFTFGRSR